MVVDYGGGPDQQPPADLPIVYGVWQECVDMHFPDPSLDWPAGVALP